MNWKRLTFNFRIGFEALLTNKLRALLTSLGIIFGVAAVIAMLAVGAGAEQEILQQMKEIGSNNIVITPNKELNKPADKNAQGADKETLNQSAGLTLQDARAIEKVVPGVLNISPEIEIDALFLLEGRKSNGKLVGISNYYFEISGLGIGQGDRFTEAHYNNAEPVCIIGKNVAERLFGGNNPIGKQVKCGYNWLTVVGVLEEKDVAEKTRQKLSIRDYNNDVFTPATTFILRYENRALVTISEIEAAGGYDQIYGEGGGETPNYHQLDRLVVTIDQSDNMTLAAELIQRILLRRHSNVNDVNIEIPEKMLQKEKKTKQQFNLVLGVIASISLLVGGIGIMNIMLASVMERIREIGLRQAIGATRNDIVLQFMSEAVTLSLAGGLIGIFLGVFTALSLEWVFDDIKTIIQPYSVFISFTISISVGLIFGIWPAKKASEQNPTESLRHD